MQQRWRQYGVVLAALMLVPAGAYLTSAEVDERSWELGALVALTTYDNESTLDSSITYGGRVAYYFKAVHGLELDFRLGSTDINTKGLDTEFDLTDISLNYIHNYKMKRETRAEPFLILGIGKLNIDNGDSDDSATTLRFGGGARARLSPHVALRFDGTLFRWRGDNDVTPSNDFFSFEVTLGVSFFFGGTGSAPAPASRGGDSDPEPEPEPEP